MSHQASVLLQRQERPVGGSSDACLPTLCSYLWRNDTHTNTYSKYLSMYEQRAVLS